MMRYASARPASISSSSSSSSSCSSSPPSALASSTAGLAARSLRFLVVPLCLELGFLLVGRPLPLAFALVARVMRSGISWSAGTSDGIAEAPPRLPKPTRRRPWLGPNTGQGIMLLGIRPSSGLMSPGVNPRVLLGGSGGLAAATLCRTIVRISLRLCPWAPVLSQESIR